MPFHEATLEQAKSRLDDIITEAAHDQQVTLITKYGVPAAYVVPLAMLRDLLPPVTPGRRGSVVNADLARTVHIPTPPYFGVLCGGDDDGALLAYDVDYGPVLWEVTCERCLTLMARRAVRGGWQRRVAREVLTPPGHDPVSSQAIYRDPDEPTSEPYRLMPPRPPKPSSRAGLAEALRAANHSGLREALDAASGTDPGALDPHEPAVTFQQGGLAARRRRWAEHLHRGLTRVDVWILISTIALVVLACLTLAWSSPPGSRSCPSASAMGGGSVHDRPGLVRE